MRAQNWVQAELELEQLARDYPTYAGPLVNLAIAYKRDGRGADAAAAIERALAVDPNHAAANTERGIMLREQGKFAEAEAAYRRALATDPEHALARYNLGVLLDMYLRRPDEALEQYELYQGSLNEPDANVAKWIVDLRRRVGSNDKATRVARGDGP
jgi:tetratricopeptide (TPR) repeat protein